MHVVGIFVIVAWLATMYKAAGLGRSAGLAIGLTVGVIIVIVGAVEATIAKQGAH